MKYFIPLIYLLNEKQIQSTLKKYPYLKRQKHELHIFLYIELRRALDRYAYIKEKRVFNLVKELKREVRKWKDMQYCVEERINVWLRGNHDKEIAEN